MNGWLLVETVPVLLLASALASFVVALGWL